MSNIRYDFYMSNVLHKYSSSSSFGNEPHCRRQDTTPFLFALDLLLPIVGSKTPYIFFQVVQAIFVYVFLLVYTLSSLTYRPHKYSQFLLNNTNEEKKFDNNHVLHLRTKQINSNSMIKGQLPYRNCELQQLLWQQIRSSSSTVRPVSGVLKPLNLSA